MTTILGTALLIMYCTLTLMFLISMIQTIWNDHKRSKYDAERDARDQEYHLKRMELLK